jgi:ABC-type multidrug transport system ATPase subunit/pSer/pThr/pTyr-binding forkhead associated (FHA) protein
VERVGFGSCGRLLVLDGEARGTTFAIGEGPHDLGRLPDARLRLPDETVSKEQAVITGTRGVARLENRSRRNPTRVNDDPVTAPRPLADGDRILCGTVNLRYEAPPRGDATPPPLPAQARRDGGAPIATRTLRHPWLTVAIPGRPPRDAVLAGERVAVGRGAENDLVLDFPTVSTRHAAVISRGTGWRIEDLGSTNGTFVNGRRLEKPHDLRDGDIVRIGDGSGNSVALAYHEEGAAARDELGTVALGRLQVEGKSSFVLGRDPACDVPLEGTLVSWRHARIQAAPGGGHTVEDLGSTNGTFVNGETVHGRRSLSAGDVVQVGPYRLVYAGGGFSRSSTAGSVRVDAVKVRRTVGSGKAARVLLHDVSLTIQPREFVAFVGGSGAGKSTMVKALAGIVRVEGAVLVNGEDLPTNYDAWKGQMGYVPQDDIVHGDLTVDHAVRYAARLRLPRDTRKVELDRAVERVLSDVEMTAHRDKLIRSLSGGQRKRVSIAVEMLSEPSLFFLDEPTSGLDPGLEKKMMFLMRRLADGGRTILMVTHATANITQCDHVAFLSRGHLVWFGPPAEALEHFGVQDFSDIYTEIEKDPEALAKRYRASEAHRKYVVERQRAVEAQSSASLSLSAAAGRPGAARGVESRAPGAARQFLLLTRRYAELVFRDRLLLTILLAVMPAIGLLLSAIAGAKDLVGLSREEVAAKLAAGTRELTPHAPVPGAEKLLFMVALAVVLLGVFGAAYELVKERAVYRRERMVSLRIGPYLASKFLVLAAFALVQCAALLGALWLRVELPERGLVLPDGRLELYVTLLLTAFAGIGLGLLVSAVTPNANTVIYLVLLAVFAQILLTGTIFRLPERAVPASLGMPTRWSLEALGSTVDMDALAGQSVSRVRKPVKVAVEFDIEIAADDLGPTLGPVAKQSGAKVPAIPVRREIERNLDEEIRVPAEFDLVYRHEREHLLLRWGGLAGFALGFGVLTAFVLAWRDRQEG